MKSERYRLLTPARILSNLVIIDLVLLPLFVFLLVCFSFFPLFVLDRYQHSFLQQRCFVR